MYWQIISYKQVTVVTCYFKISFPISSPISLTHYLKHSICLYLSMTDVYVLQFLILATLFGLVTIFNHSVFTTTEISKSLILIKLIRALIKIVSKMIITKSMRSRSEINERHRRPLRTLQ